MSTIRAARVVTPEGIVPRGEVRIDDGRFVDVRETSGPVPERTLIPGLVDLQVNGHRDVDVATADARGWERLDQLLLSQGVTAWCPTLTSAPLAAYADRLATISEAANRPGRFPMIAGAHLEGPFLDPDHAGAHPVENLCAIDQRWLDGLPPIVRIVTLAPELDGAVGAIRTLSRRGLLVALGHSGADLPTVRAATEAGARLVTHLFNAMGRFHHRAPGLAGAGLTDSRLAVSVIADLVHLDPVAIQLVFAAKAPGLVALVTDALAWEGGGPGGVPVRIEQGAPRLPDGTIAGSTLTLDQAVRNCIDAAGVPLETAVRAAATVPADLLGLADRGRISAGSVADLVALDAELRVSEVWLAGEPVYRAA